MMHHVFRYIFLSFFIFYSLSLFAHGKYPKDYQISEYVETQIALDKTTKDLNIEVTTNNGIVTLVGHACTNVKAYKLIEIAQCTTGVKNVNADQLTLAFGRRVAKRTIQHAKSVGAYKQRHSLHCISM